MNDVANEEQSQNTRMEKKGAKVSFEAFSGDIESCS